ncbi:MAG: phosphoribosylglycinamide formyltransferase [Proteobacteria bacterium]|nr:phosphoribosylglycinamide formyltransferase [Pseudomonadota bacterium]
MTSKKIKTAILISGRGSNMQALVESCKDPKFPAEITLVISNKSDAAGLAFAKANNIKTAIVNHKDFPSREAFDQQVSAIITENNCQLVCLAGFMRILSKWFVTKWSDRLINIHPSLLPSFKGGNAVRDALEYGVKISGCTVHFVTEEMDSGPIIAQAAVAVAPNDNVESLAARILEKEHIIYSQALKSVCQNINQQ